MIWRCFNNKDFIGAKVLTFVYSCWHQPKSCSKTWLAMQMWFGIGTSGLIFA